MFISIRLLEFASSCKHALKTHNWKLHIEALLLASVAVHVTVVQPTGNVEPEGGLQTAAGFGQLSVTIGAG